MPYDLLRVSRDKYYVYNLLSGRRYSNEPISRRNAEAQLRILRSLGK